MSRDQQRLRHRPISNEYSNFAEAKPERVSDDVAHKIGPLDFKYLSNPIAQFPNKLETPQSNCSNIGRESGFKGPLAKIKFQELNRQAEKGIAQKKIDGNLD